MKKRSYFLFCASFLAALAVGFVVALEKTSAEVRANDDVSDLKHKADDEAIRKVSSDFSRALGEGDAKAVAGYWTEEGEYLGGDGTTLRGRAAIEEAYAQFFKKAVQAKVETTIDSIRFVSQDAAIEEGFARTHKGKAELPTSSRYSILYVRDNGQWRMALLREWPDQGVAVRDMDWLIGTWTAKTGRGEIRSTYEWDETKKFIRCRFTIKTKETALSGTQIIGRDPRTGNLRSWLFESNGGFGEAEWSWDGKRWIQDATGVQEDGDEVTATNILTPLDKDSFTWQSIDRTENGEDVPNIPPVKVTRVK